MKFISLIVWVTQFGVSLVFPTLAFTWLGFWLHNKFGLGAWIVILLGVLGLLTSVSTAKSCWRAMQKEAFGNDDKDEPPVAFNSHS